MRPRWRKVLRDLSSNKIRTTLVVLSVAMGMFAVGMVANAQVILSRELPRSYLAVLPSSAIFYTGPFSEDLLSSVRSTRGVQQVEGRSSVLVRVQTGPDTWQSLQLFAIPDFRDIRVDIVRPVSGAWPPAKRSLVIERNARGLVPAAVGSLVRVETADGKQRDLLLSGAAHDLTIYPANLIGRAYGYITYDTLEWLSGSRDYSELHVVLNPEIRSRQAVQEMVDQIRKKLELSGVNVFSTYIPPYPDKPPVNDIIQTMVEVLAVLGLLSLTMSVFLIINTISALLMQQRRQIGVMKAIGARTRQIISMYSVMIVVIGLLAALIAVPSGLLGAYLTTGYIAGLINYSIVSFQVPLPILLLQAGVGLIVPLLAALYPILAGTRVTVRESLAPTGGHFGAGLIDRLIGRVHFLSRPLLLSLRNTVRRKGRLLLTLLTLAMAGAIFVATLSVRSSALQTLGRSAEYWNYDAAVWFQQPYHTAQIEQAALQVPGVARVETWLQTDVRRLRGDGHESNSIALIAPPAGTGLLRPRLLEGRWLLPEDENGLVINTDVSKTEPDIRVGDQVTLLINERKTSWRVVGVIAGQLSGAAMYTNYASFAQEGRSVGRANFAAIVTQHHTPEFRSAVTRAVEQQLKGAGLRISTVQTTSSLFAGLQSQFDILVSFLFIMALLLGLIGGLSLMGMMSLNVLERTREIGIMRAIGASSRSILQIVVVEGCCIGAVSWWLGVLLAYPVSQQMSTTVGMVLLQTPLDYQYSLAAAGLWLGVVLGLAVLASSLPAWNAIRVRVRDVLAYE